jgi:hypothetical protein
MSPDEVPQTGSPAIGRRIEYLAAYRAAIASPNWLINLLWGLLAFFSSNVIPFIGGLIWTGYTYECVERWHVTRGKELADFDVNRLGDYLTRGAVPFLIQMVLWFALFAAYLLVYVGIFAFALIADAVGDEYAMIVLAAGLPLLALAVGFGLLLLTVFLSPLMLRAGLAQDLGVAFRLSWWRDFLRRVGLELLLTTLFVLVTGTLLTLLGCAALFVGSYFVWPWVTLASAHLAWQLYELYLGRGGEPIPLKPKQVIPPLRAPGYGFPGYVPAVGQPPPPPGANI